MIFDQIITTYPSRKSMEMRLENLHVDIED